MGPFLYKALFFHHRKARDYIRKFMIGYGYVHMTASDNIPS